MRLKKGPIRLMVVEDSPTARDLLVALFNQTSDVEVVATAADGEEAVKLAIELRPDVITMDIHMPRLNGLEAARQILQIAPIPIVMVTSSLNRRDMNLTFEALRVGALTVIKKPVMADDASCKEVVQIVKLMADVQVVRRWKREPAGPELNPARLDTAALNQGWGSSAIPPPQPKNGWAAVGIASSTGGPAALVSVLKNLPEDYPLPVLVVQHITRGFAGAFSEWLNGELKLRVKLAVHGETPLPGTLLIAPDDMHMQISDRRTILLHSSPPYKGLRPSANYLFFSMARVYQHQAVGVVLTGMGDDGADGLADLHRCGGMVLAQEEASCVVYGMPREAVARSAVDQILPPEQIGSTLMRLPLKRA
jgi:two-component system chemotaxis response regulator CheB